ncbi:MAG: hypothetical protein JSS81_06135 [Acidobacteria bacterium]|nr:hypothetical protein [Acidobacteriota bacterium]
MSFRNVILCILLLGVGAPAALAQNQTDASGKTDKKEAKTDKKEEKNDNKQQVVDPSKLTAEQVAESTILIYGGLLGRQNLNQIRKTTLERGKIFLTDAKGRAETVNYDRWILRGDNLNKEKIRVDQAFPNGEKFSLIYTGDKVFGIYKDSVFTPREDATSAFQNQIWHGLEGLLRYKENESKLELAGRDKVMGVEYFLLDVTDKQNRKTRFYVSLKSYRVMMLEYEEAGVKYRRKFYDYRYAQGTLVPYRSVLWADDKQIEESEIGTTTFGQKVEPELFQEG